MWHRTIPAAEQAVPAGRLGQRAYQWSGGALVGLGVVQLLADRPAGILFLALIAVVVCGAAVWHLPAAPLLGSIGVAAAVATMVLAIGVPVFATFVATMVAAFSLTRYVGVRQALLGFAVLVIGIVVFAVRVQVSGQDGLFGLVYPAVYIGGSGVVGWLARQRALYLRSLEDRTAALERDQTQQAAIATAAERARIARDLHDVVSHGVSLMVVQAEAAREVLASRPDQAAVALDAISAAGRQAISDLQRMMGVLRDPAATMRLADLLAPVRAAGLTVNLVQTGDPAEVDEDLHRIVYRIAQEALTNTMRHAEASHARLRVHYGAERIELEVLDDGAGPARGVETGPTRGGGHGVAGMRERAASVQGDLTAGPRTDDRGFRVYARLPRRSMRMAG